MSAPIPPVPPVVVVPDPPRPSASLHVESVANSVIVKIIGLIMFAGSGYFEYLEVLKTDSQSNAKLFLFAGVAVFGVALAFTQPVVAATKGIIVVIGPYIPTFGRRKDDAG